MAGKYVPRGHPRPHPVRYLSAASLHPNRRPVPKRPHRAPASRHTSSHPQQRPRGRNSRVGQTGWRSGAPLRPMPDPLTKLRAEQPAFRNPQPLKRRLGPLGHCVAVPHRPVPTAPAIQSRRGSCSALHPPRHRPIGKRHRAPRQDLEQRRATISMRHEKRVTRYGSHCGNGADHQGESFSCHPCFALCNRSIGHKFRQDFSAGDDAGQPGAGMGSCADKIEAAGLFAHIMGSEPSAL